MRFLSSATFWKWSLPTLALLVLFFGWELGKIALPIASPPRPEPTQLELWFSAVLIGLLSLNAGLFGYNKECGTCPIGAKRASGIAGAIGAVALLCPMCLLLPISLFGLSLSLAILAPFLPLLRVIALILLVVSTKMMWPKS